MISDHINKVRKNGGILSVDDASELIDVYQKNKSENRIATNVVASKLVEQAFNHKLNNLDSKKDNVAVFTAGGPASFKSSSVNAFIRTNKLNPQFIFDSNLANFDTAVSLIDKTLNKGLGVRIIYSYRNVIDAWKSNLERAGKHERVVALNTFIRNHLDAPETLIKLQEKYQDNPNVGFKLFNQNIKNGDKSTSFDKLRSLLYDNNNGKISRLDTGKGQTLSRSISESVRDGRERISRAQKETSLREQAKAIAAAGYQSGAISEQVYRGALRGHLDERKFTAGKTSKKSPIKSLTKVKQMK